MPDGDRGLSLDEALSVAVALQQAEQWAAAAEIYRSILEAAPDHAGALHFSGVLAHQQERGDEAVGLIERSLELEPDQPDWHSNLGIVLQDRLRLDEATAAYERAVELDPGHANAHNNLGVVYAPNVTLGVNVLLAALKIVARALPEFDYLITETHHNKKFDIPSGTAKKIAGTIRKELPKDAEVPIHSARVGGYVGVHTVLLASDSERLSLTHESFNRSAFASGALRAAKFILGKSGWYEMEDVLGFADVLERAASAV